MRLLVDLIPSDLKTGDRQPTQVGQVHRQLPDVNNRFQLESLQHFDFPFDRNANDRLPKIIMR